MLTKHKDLITSLVNNKIILFDKSKTYRLKSGSQSCLYIDFRRALSFPIIQAKLCQLYCDWITQPFGPQFDCIVGVPEGAVPMAAQISAKLSVPLIMVRKQVKKHGTQNLIEGVIKPGARVLIIEDIVTTGGSVLEIVKILRQHDLVPAQILCLLKRSKISLGQMFALDISNGIVPLASLLRMKEIELIVKLQASRLCVAADVTTMAELAHIIKKTSPYASIIKTHIDMIKDFIPTGEHNSVQLLQNLKNQYGILLWEDRKFADIAPVTNKQITQGLHKISQWADIVSVHTISGPEVFRATQNRNYVDGCHIIAIAQMSSKGTLSTQEYLEQSIQMLDPLGSHEKILNINPDPRSDSEFKNVIGIVTQTDVKTSLLKIVPGINNIRKGACVKSQQYRHIDEVKEWADIVVVGRGITDYIDHQNFEQICQSYLV